jgi:hypothetical protein
MLSFILILLASSCAFARDIGQPGIVIHNTCGKDIVAVKYGSNLNGTFNCVGTKQTFLQGNTNVPSWSDNRLYIDDNATLYTMTGTEIPFAIEGTSCNIPGSKITDVTGQTDIFFCKPNVPTIVINEVTKHNLWWVALIAAGGVILFVIIGILACVCCRK